MSILCGTDFSEESTKAVRAVAALAARFREPLILVHVLDTGSAELAFGQHAPLEPLRQRLHEAAAGFDRASKAARA